MICPNCGNQTSEGAIFCDRCGTRLPQPEAVAAQPAPVVAGGSVICPACGAGNVPGEAFCDFCGSPLEPPMPAAEEVVALESVSGEAELEVAPASTPAEAAMAPAPVPAPAEPVVEQAAPPAPAEAEAKLTCPVCGAEVSPGEAFCANCGASLAQAPIPPEPVPEVEAAPVPAPAEAESILPPEPVVTVAPPPEAPVAVPAGPLTCPSCGAEVEAKDVFCSNCGFALKAAPASAPVAAVTAPSPVEATPAPSPVAAGPRLVVVASGAEIPLPAGEELLIGREDPVSGIYPEVDLMPHGGEEGGVSRRHARIIQEGGDYYVEDLDSTNFTFVNKQKLTPKIRQPLKYGDEVRFGRVALIFKLGS